METGPSQGPDAQLPRCGLLLHLQTCVCVCVCAALRPALGCEVQEHADHMKYLESCLAFTISLSGLLQAPSFPGLLAKSPFAFTLKNSFCHISFPSSENLGIQPPHPDPSSG